MNNYKRTSISVQALRGEARVDSRVIVRELGNQHLSHGEAYQEAKRAVESLAQAVSCLGMVA